MLATSALSALTAAVRAARAELAGADLAAAAGEGLAELNLVNGTAEGGENTHANKVKSSNWGSLSAGTLLQLPVSVESVVAGVGSSTTSLPAALKAACA